MLHESSMYTDHKSLEIFMEKLLEKNDLSKVKNHKTPMYKLAIWLEERNTCAVNNNEEIVFLRDNIIIPNGRRNLLEIIADPIPTNETGTIHTVIYRRLQREYQNFSPQQRKLFLWDIRAVFLPAFLINAEIAGRYAENHDGGWGGIKDAFRHALWLALNTQVAGAAFARKWGDAHEYRTPRTPFLQAEVFMDIHNNEIGIEIGRKNPLMGLQVIIRLVERQIELGNLLIMKPIPGIPNDFFNALFKNNDLNYENIISFDDNFIKRKDVAQNIVDNILRETSFTEDEEIEIININGAIT